MGAGSRAVNRAAVNRAAVNRTAVNRKPKAKENASLLATRQAWWRRLRRWRGAGPSVTLKNSTANVEGGKPKAVLIESG